MFLVTRVIIPSKTYFRKSLVDKQNFWFRCIMAFKYPAFRRDATVDDYYGHKVPDPYRWLEDPTSKDTQAFIEAQNNLTMPYLKSCPDREKINKKLTALWNYPKYECAFKAGDYYYFKMNSGLQNHGVLYKLKELHGDPEVFIDPNTFSSEGLISMTNYSFSEDGHLMAYSLSESGSDWQKIKIRSALTHEDLPDLIKDVKYSTISWTHDNKGFFYTKCPNPDNDDGTKTTEHQFSKLYYHRVGTSQAEDVLCVEFPDEPRWMPRATVSDCGKYVFVAVHETCKNELVYFCDLKSLSGGISGLLPLTPITGKFEAEFNYITNDGTRVFFHTDKNAPLYRIVLVDLLKPGEENWVNIIPEDPKNVLEWSLCTAGDKLLNCYIADVKSVLSLYDLKTGKLLHTFELDVGHVGSPYGERKENEIFFKFSSFMNPGILYYCNLKEGLDVEVFRTISNTAIDPAKYETTQIFYTSKDGTKVPMFIIHKKDFVKDGSAPALLYGYGGFNISVLPTFSSHRLAFVQHFNGVLAIPNIRGGGEYGEMWHLGGSKFNKQNVFDDFQAAAEYLIANKYTTPKKLVIDGGSNGGLLVGACINQRPDLFGCAIAQVPVMDMLRYHKFTIGHAWKSDYCCADDNEEEFKYLLKFSPLHNIQVPKDENVQYPAVLLVTGDHDDRVVPLHSLKFIAELQYKLGNCEKQKNPLMIRVDTQSGHGHGKPTSKIIEEATDIFCFISNAIGVEFQD